MGLKKGEKVQHIHQIRIISATLERLDTITPPECVREGFPHMEPEEFVDMFCRANKCGPEEKVNRIAFFHLLT